MFVKRVIAKNHGQKFRTFEPAVRLLAVSINIIVFENMAGSLSEKRAHPVHYEQLNSFSSAVLFDTLKNLTCRDGNATATSTKTMKLQ